MSKLNGITNSFKFAFNGTVLKIRGITPEAKMLLKLKKYAKAEGIQAAGVVAAVSLLQDYEAAIVALSDVLKSI